MKHRAFSWHINIVRIATSLTGFYRGVARGVFACAIAHSRSEHEISPPKWTPTFPLRNLLLFIRHFPVALLLNPFQLASSIAECCLLWSGTITIQAHSFLVISTSFMYISMDECITPILRIVITFWVFFAIHEDELHFSLCIFATKKS